MRLAVAIIIMILLGCAAWSSHHAKPFIQTAEAVTIVCKPEVYPEPYRNRRIVRT